MLAPRYERRYNVPKVAVVGPCPRRVAWVAGHAAVQRAASCAARAVRSGGVAARAEAVQAATEAYRVLARLTAETLGGVFGELPSRRQVCAFGEPPRPKWPRAVDFDRGGTTSL